MTRWLSAQPTGPPPGGPEFGQSSPLALIVILLLLVAVAALVYSMNKHLRRVPRSFDEPRDTDPDPGRSDGEQDGSREE